MPGQLASTHIKDVVSHTLGIGLKDDIYDAIIPKDHVIPHKVVRDGYSTAEDNQTRIWVPVYQGDNPKASLNFLLGELFADAVSQTCDKLDIPLAALNLIGCHGQTIFHEGEPIEFFGYRVASTLQIGEPAIIAKRTGVTTIADFRCDDIGALHTRIRAGTIYRLAYGGRRVADADAQRG